MKWIDDDAAKVVLLDMGLETSDEVISAMDIDKVKSAQNRARATPLDDTRIEGISAAAEKGVPIPKIVVRKEAKGAYVIAGGNHRFAACATDRDIIPVHVIQCTDAEFETACRVLNTVVGVGMTKAERLAAALDDIQRLGITQSMAAGLYGVSKKQVSEAAIEQDTRRRVAAVVPASVAKQVTKTHIKNLGELARNDNILKAACMLVSKAKLTVSQISDLTKEAKTKHTEADQLAVFEDAVTIHCSERPRIIPRRKRSEFASTLKRIKNLEGVQSWSALEIEPREVEVWTKQVDEAISILQRLSKVSG
jgi:uncharacterized ParB-like nuclease family protein